MVYFANCYSGLSITEDLVQMVMGGEYPVINSGIMDYPRHDSLPVQLVGTYLKLGIDEVIQKIKEMKNNPAQSAKVSEKILRSFSSDLQDAGDKEAALKIFQFRFETNPQSFAAHRDLARAYLETGDKKKSKNYYKKTLDLKKDKNVDIKPINWALEYIAGLEKPVKLPLDRLEAMAGDYGERHITLSQGSLYYFRENATTKEPKKLIPISTDTFIMEDLLYFRLRFVLDEKGAAKKLLGIYEWGTRDESPRDK